MLLWLRHYGFVSYRIYTAVTIIEINFFVLKLLFQFDIVHRRTLSRIVRSTSRISRFYGIAAKWTLGWKYDPRPLDRG